MTETTIPSDFDIAAYWQFRMSQSQTMDITQPDISLDQFLAITPIPPTVEELVAYANQTLATFLATAREFNVGKDTQVIVLADGTSGTRADLALLALYGQGSPSGTKVWIDNNGKCTILTGDQLVALATAVGTWIANCYGDLSTIIAEITAASPNITSNTQIDSYSWHRS